MTNSNHNHPTFGVCTCGHLDFFHPWTTGERVDYQGHCEGDNHGIMCSCESFHADPWTTKEGSR